MKTTVLKTLTFGREGNAEAHQLYGWSVPEAGHTWTVGHEAALHFPPSPAPFGLFVELRGHPHVVPGSNVGQRLIVKVNGQKIAEADVTKSACLAWYVPPDMLYGHALVVTLELPDAFLTVNPNDPRVLGVDVRMLRLLRLESGLERPFAPMPGASIRLAASPLAPDLTTAADHVMRATNLDVPGLARQIEGLGANCELGFFQRQCGIEPIGLFRFSSTILEALVDGIDTSFTQLGNQNAIDPVAEETTLKDWVIYERRYLMRYHTWVAVEDATSEQMKRRESKKLGFLKEKLLDDIAEGTKLFVYQEGNAVALDEILPLFLALRRVGPAALLWIVPANPSHPPGTVEELYPGLLKGYFSIFSLGAIGRPPSQVDWVTVLANAYALHRMPHIATFPALPLQSSPNILQPA